MEKVVCNICNVKDCGYKSRNMEDRCTKVAYYERGWDDAVGEILKWLRNSYRNYMHNPTGEKLEAFFGGDMITDLEKEFGDE